MVDSLSSASSTIFPELVAYVPVELRIHDV